MAMAALLACCASVVLSAPARSAMRRDVSTAAFRPMASLAGSFRRYVLTPGPERFLIRRRKTGNVAMRGSNPSGAKIRDWNRRELFSETGAARSRNQTTCATWRSQTKPSIQQGLAVRIRETRQRVRAVTVLKNTWANFFWVFNVLTWDTGRRGDPWRTVEQFDMSDVVSRDGQLVPLPWRVCMRSQARTVAFKVWLPASEPEPSWSDATHVREARLPRSFVISGVPGWYIGHLPAGEETVYSGLST